MDPHEIVEVDTEVVGCDGGGGVLGHPLVYLNMEKGGAVDCPYCGRKFVRKAGQGGGALKPRRHRLRPFARAIL